MGACKRQKLCLIVYLKNTIKYLNYLIKAKGRHGTHSPFVYAFVEEVLHDRRHFYVEQQLAEASAQSGYEAPLIRSIFKTILYLKPEVTVLQGNTFKLKKIAQSAHRQMPIGPDIDTFLSANNPLIIIDSKDVTSPDIIEIQQRCAQFAILLLFPHQMESHWEQLISNPTFQTTLDCWNFGLLVANPAFKAKQHFYVR
jgi:hypothetical protein